MLSNALIGLGICWIFIHKTSDNPEEDLRNRLSLVFLLAVIWFFFGW